MTRLRSVNLIGGTTGAVLSVGGVALLVAILTFRFDDVAAMTRSVGWWLVGSLCVLPVVLAYGAITGSFLARRLALRRAARR